MRAAGFESIRELHRVRSRHSGHFLKNVSMADLRTYSVPFTRVGARAGHKADCQDQVTALGGLN